MRNLILYGHKNSGKTYWGERIAREFGYTAINTDQRIETIYRQESGKNKACREIYHLLGETGFRKLEQRAIFSLKEAIHSVISVGGGTVLAQNHREFLSQIGTLIYLKIDKALLKERTLSQALPAYFDQTNPESSFETIYHQRTPLYEAISAVQIVVNGEDIMDQFKAIVNGK